MCVSELQSSLVVFGLKKHKRRHPSRVSCLLFLCWSFSLLRLLFSLLCSSLLFASLRFSIVPESIFSPRFLALSFPPPRRESKSSFLPASASSTASAPSSSCFPSLLSLSVFPLRLPQVSLSTARHHPSPSSSTHSSSTNTRPAFRKHKKQKSRYFFASFWYLLVLFFRVFLTRIEMEKKTGPASFPLARWLSLSHLPENQRLRVHEPRVLAPLELRKLRVSARFDDSSFFDDADPVGGHHRRERVRDDQNRPPFQ